eukprot:Gb_26992 [translate_table: standard]
MAAHFSGTTTNICGRIFTLLMIFLCILVASARLFPAAMEVKNIGTRDHRDSVAEQQNHNYNHMGMQDFHPKVTVDQKGSYKSLYNGMLPKGPVPPSGPSPCHNSFPENEYTDVYYPCSTSAVP